MVKCRIGGRIIEYEVVDDIRVISEKNDCF